LRGRQHHARRRFAALVSSRASTSRAPGRVVDDEVSVLGVPPHVRVDERAHGNHVQPALAGVVERGGDQRGAEAAASGRRVDLGVEEGDDALAAVAIDELADRDAVEPQLVAALVGEVRDGELVVGQADDGTSPGIDGACRLSSGPRWSPKPASPSSASSCPLRRRSRSRRG
jgi:hypothetical protein